MTLDDAINLLKKAVKYSTIEKQKHIDLSVCVASERPLFQKALVVTKVEVEKGTLSEEELKERLGII